MPIILTVPGGAAASSSTVVNTTSVLTLVQQACQQMGIPAPNSLVGNLDADAIQLLALFQDLGSELVREHNWQDLTREYRFNVQSMVLTGTTSAGVAQVTGLSSTAGLDPTFMLSGAGVPNDTYIYSVDSASQVTLSQASTQTGTAPITFGKTKYSLPSDWDRQINRTHFDKSRRWEMLGPETAQQWEWLKSSYISTGPRVRYRIVGGYFQIWPLIATPDLLGFEYISKAWVATSAGTSFKNSVTVDSDVVVFPDRLMITGLKNKYFMVKGLGDRFEADYRNELSKAKAVDAGAQTLSMGAQRSSVLIGIDQIPDGGYGNTP